jgi:uncharacterized protein (AIM24 family)
MATTITAGNATNGLAFSADNTGILEFKTGTGSGTTAITVSTAQVVSIPGNLSFNSGYGSSAVAYGCRAWVNFNGTGTVAIRASGNVSSITDNGTGDYTVNFTTAMPDVNYSAVASGGDASTDARIAITTSLATGSYKITTRTVGNALFDTLTVQSAVFR